MYIVLALMHKMPFFFSIDLFCILLLAVVISSRPSVPFLVEVSVYLSSLCCVVKCLLHLLSCLVYVRSCFHFDFWLVHIVQASMLIVWVRVKWIMESMWSNLLQLHKLALCRITFSFMWFWVFESSAIAWLITSWNEFSHVLLSSSRRWSRLTQY